MPAAESRSLAGSAPGSPTEALRKVQRSGLPGRARTSSLSGFSTKAERRALGSSNQSGRSARPLRRLGNGTHRLSRARWRFGSGPGKSCHVTTEGRSAARPRRFHCPSRAGGKPLRDSDLGGLLAEGFRIQSENYEFREKTTSPGLPRAVGASARALRTRLTGGKSTKL